MADEVVQTAFGKFLISTEDLIGSTTKAGTLWDGPGFLQPIAIEHGRLGEAGTTILDVGANQGMFSVWLAAHGAWRVIAVEPQPDVYQRLIANLDLNREVCADHVVTVMAAAYHHTAILQCSPLDPGNWGGTTMLAEGTINASGVRGIPAYPLDTLQWMFGTRVSLIKLDAQGCDGAAILGLRQTIQRDRPAVVFEWDADLAKPHGIYLRDILEWFTAVDYTVHEWPSHPHNYLALPKTGVPA